ncbi:MAG: ABC transporter substrate-binding protein, partial [Clostridia bacterium]|nr:ABC transporter substrate-binding protein [Clostridia bacterium]
TTAATEAPTEAKPEKITVQSLNANKEMADLEVPFDPQRIAILDMAALDIIDSLGLGDRIVGSAKVTIEYLTQYNPDDSDGKSANLGSVKTADMEQVAACEPEIIFIGGRLSKEYDNLSAIAPVVYLSVDYEKGVVTSTADNAKTIASIFGLEEEIEAKMEGFQTRIDALSGIISGKDILLAMYNNNAMSLMDTQSQLNILAAELGGNNLGETVGEVDKAAHGEDSSWETIVNLNPEYMFVLDRSTATGAADEGVLGAREVIENDLIKELDVYKNGNIVYFIEHANVWYTSTGGIQALDTMLADLEAALIK